MSVYRIIECLEDNGLLHRVLSTGKVKKCAMDHHEDDCHLPQRDHCHHLLLCSGCGKVEEVHCPGFEDVVKSVASATKFLIQQHRLEFSGLCPACQKN